MMTTTRVRGGFMGTQNKCLIVMGRKSAKVFSISGRESTLKWLKTLRNPLGAERNRVMSHDKPGMSVGKFKNNRSPHALTGGKNPHEEVAIEFAKKVGTFVKHLNEGQEFSNLTIAAESHMLGLMKKAFKKEKVNVDINWIKKDLDKMTTKKIEKLIFHSEH
jgi:protein required for attachment to host cells